MKTCKVCEKPYRSGRLAYVPDATGQLVRMRVCTGCAHGGLTIVVQRPAVKQVENVLRNPQLDAIHRRIERFRGMSHEAPAAEAYDRCLALIAAAQEGRPL